jgi:tricorn protease
VAWSPDGRWLAYAWPSSRNACGLRLYDLTRRRTHDLTRPEFVDYEPAFDPEGKYLYFLSRRVFDPVYDAHYFDLGFPRGVRAYLVPLAKDTPSPFAPATQPPRAPGATAKRAEAPAGAPSKRPPLRLDVDGIADRVVAMPVPEARYVSLAATPGRVLLGSLPVEGSLHTPWHESGPPPAKMRLDVLELERAKPELLVDGITAFDLSLDAKTLILRVRNRLRVLPATSKAKDLSSETQAGRETGWIDLARLRVEVLPGAEWRQMFREAWRLQRDQFWTPDMAQVDWPRIHDRYLPLVERAATRTEFSDLLWELQGELGTSHCYELGGDYSPQPGYHQGFLGADLELEARTGRWRVARIPSGDTWDAAAASPLAAPAAGIAEGDVVLAVNGVEVGARRTPFECLVHHANRDVLLVVQRGRGKPRVVAVRTLVSEDALRYRDWVEANRSFVHAKTRGRIGYVHVPDMGPWGYAEFHRGYKQEVDHDGLIVDVRWNRGGHVSQLLLEKLARRRIAYDLPRWHAAEPYPNDAPMGPMVALTNEFAGSDGDIFCHAFKLMRLGPLIGKRTWGGVIGIWPRHSLVDGTVTTQPEFGNWFEDVGFGVENYGTDPDIVVEITPQDHARHRDPQLERAIAEVLKLVRGQPPRRPHTGAVPHRRPPRLPGARRPRAT